MVTMVDRLFNTGLDDFAAPTKLRAVSDLPAPPLTLLHAVWRGVRGRCPKCEFTHLFRTFLKPVSKCVACGEDWQARSSDDFPPYIVILLLGHILAPGMISLETLARPPFWVHLVLWLPLVAILGTVLIQPVKGGVMALQWWLADCPAKIVDPQQEGANQPTLTIFSDTEE